MKLVLADDATLLREGLAGLLERQGHEIIGQAADATSMETLVCSLAQHAELPDVLVADVRMPPSMHDDGLKSAINLRRSFPEMGIMILSQYVAPAYARTLFADKPMGLPSPAKDTGGIGYLLKDRVSRVVDFVNSLQIVCDGGVVVDPEVAAALMQQRSSSLDALTPREQDVLEMMARGLSNTQIAAELVLSSASISKYVASIFMKLGMSPNEDNRRVRAVLEYLTATSGPAGGRAAWL